MITPTTKVHLWDFYDQTVSIELVRLAAITKKARLELKIGSVGPAIETGMALLKCPDDFPHEEMVGHLETSYENIMAQYEGKAPLVLTDLEGNFHES